MNDQASPPATPTSEPPSFDQPPQASEAYDTVDIEMSALKLLLESKTISSGDFASAMQTVFDLGKMSTGWKAAFELAYENQPASRRILYRDSMTRLYLWFKDYQMAEKFLAGNPVLPGELADAMEVYLQLKRYDDAKAVADICGQRMVYCSDPDSQRFLLKILNRYHRAMNARVDKRHELLRLMASLDERWEKQKSA